MQIKLFKPNLAYNSLFKPFRFVVKYILAGVYPLFIRIYRLPSVASIEETIDKLIIDKCSICRFGDGELLYISERRNLPFQKQNENLRQRFIEILKSREPKILIGLPIGFQSLKNLKKEVALTWKAIIVWTYPGIRKFLDLQKKYYNSSMTRLYIGFIDTSKSKMLFEKFKSLWEDRDILLVEGEKSRVGIGNDLFDNARTIRRVLAPAHDAFDKYKEILNEVSKYPSSNIVLISLGPTAKPLTYDLSKQGYQVIDIGNLDIEYEWYKMGASSIVRIKGKYTSEAKNGREVEDILDDNYLNQIVSRII